MPIPSTTAHVRVTNVSKSFETPEGQLSILKDLSFEIGEAEVVAIIGPSGSGKTTLLNIISGIDLPTTGSVHIGKTDITQLTDDERSTFRARELGFVFQDFLLLDHLTVAENVMLPIQMNGIEARFTLDNILNRVGLLPKKNSRIQVLSRGERQRVAIARAFIGKIPFLLADEPTGNLDVTNGQKIMDMLLDFSSELGVTVLLVTHDPEIYRRANRVIDIAKLNPAVSQ